MTREQWPTFSPPIGSGILRQSVEDFRVDEIPLVTATGQGEHIWLKIRKRNMNTDWVASLLAKRAVVAKKAVSYAGLKDRHAITTQWFSVHLPGKTEPNWSQPLSPEIEILSVSRHQQKLRRGTLKGNRFTITIRHYKGDYERLLAKVALICQRGVPNYFGEQRFGRQYSNIEGVKQWFESNQTPKKRHLRSLYLSAARSWIFNEILAKRVKQDNWDKALAGDIFMLNGTRSWFVDPVDDAIRTRVLEKDLHPSGSLWGQGKLLTQDSMRILEENIAFKNTLLCRGLVLQGLKQDRRALRLLVEKLALERLDRDNVRLRFSLPAGCYATTVLRELLAYRAASNNQ